MEAISSITPAVARKLGHYVYLYVNPLDESVFYVGKGSGARALAHLAKEAEHEVGRTLEEIRSAGAEPRIEILTHSLPNAQAALLVESAAIDLLGLSNLSNSVRGWRSAKFGRMPLTELTAHYSRRKVDIREPAILIRINRLYRYGMSDSELYDATRSAWKVGERRREATELAFAIFEGVVREVYRIAKWLPGGSTFSSRKDIQPERLKGRWEFVGAIAEDSVRNRYVNRYVGHLFSQGAQNPVAYVNVD